VKLTVQRWANSEVKMAFLRWESSKIGGDSGGQGKKRQNSIIT